MTSPITMTDAIRQAVLYQITNIHTAMPASIVSYDYTTQKASVQPLINKVWSNGNTQAIPILQNVPVAFPRSGGASLTFPVNVGDTCLLIFCERSLDQWLTTGGQVNPLDPRKFDLSDSVAIMGVFPFSETSYADNNSDVLLTYAGSNVRIQQNGDMVLQTSGKIAIGNNLAEVLDILSQTLTLLSTSFTTNPGAAFAFAKNWATLKTQLTLIKGTIP